MPKDPKPNQQQVDEEIIIKAGTYATNHLAYAGKIRDSFELQQVILNFVMPLLQSARQQEREAVVKPLIELINAQAEDEALWFKAEHATEAYLQQELRKLHDLIEQLKSNQCFCQSYYEDGKIKDCTCGKCIIEKPNKPKCDHTNILVSDSFSYEHLRCKDCKLILCINSNAVETLRQTRKDQTGVQIVPPCPKGGTCLAMVTEWEYWYDMGSPSSSVTSDISMDRFGIAAKVYRCQKCLRVMEVEG